MELFSISIPTYNRPQYLRELLLNLCDSSNKFKVGISVFDNSDDKRTFNMIREIKSNFKYLKYFKNIKNIGYVNNQIKCFEKSSSMYTAFLSDDDIYLNNAIEKILEVINNNNELSFIALNYYSFKKNFKSQNKNNFAPVRDVYFNRGYDVLNYPSVGHFSGFIFNTKLIQKEIIELKKKYGSKVSCKFEKHRGIVTLIANISLSKSKLPSYFIGDRILAAREPDKFDYDLLNHLNYDNLIFYKNLYDDNIIEESDFKYKKSLVLKSLPKAIMIESLKKSSNEYNKIKIKFDSILNDDFKYKFFIRPLFRISQNSVIKIFWFISYKIYKIFKK